MDEIPGDLIDLERYPLDALDSPAGEALLADCRAQFARDGACNLPGFLSAAGVAALAGEATALMPQAYFKSARRNAYFTPDDPALPPDHPRRLFFHTQIGQVAWDQIGQRAQVARLYRWSGLTEFLRRALGLAALHPMADAFQAVNYTYFRDGDHQAWHFDDGEFVITLLLQEAEAGGIFEYAPAVRGPGEENAPEVARVLRGESERVVALPRTAGTLTLFRGMYAVHRVSRVSGPTPRITAILSYDVAPGCVADDDVNVFTYGPRVARLLGREDARTAIAADGKAG